MSKKLLMAAAGAAAIFASSPVLAQTAGGLLDVDLTIVPTCRLVGNGGGSQNGASLSFGTVNPLTQTGDLDSETGTSGQAGFNITCNVSSTSASIALDGGEGFTSGSRQTAGRILLGNIAYEVHSAPSRSPASRYVPNVPQPVNGGVIDAGAAVFVPFYGRVPAAQVTDLTKPADLYTDRVIVTLSF